MTDEKKTLKFQMMMSPAEAKELDDWMFKNRVRSRAEAIRRLCQIGLYALENDEKSKEYRDDFLSKLANLVEFGFENLKPKTDDKFEEIVDKVTESYHRVALSSAKTVALAHALSGDKYDHIDLDEVVKKAKEHMSHETEILARLKAKIEEDED